MKRRRKIKPDVSVEEQRDIERSINRSNLKRDSSTLEAANSELKGARVHARFNKDDIKQLKAIAARLGIPYQTLLGSIVHRFVSGWLVDIEDAKHTLATFSNNKRAS